MYLKTEAVVALARGFHCWVVLGSGVYASARLVLVFKTSTKLRRRLLMPSLTASYIHVRRFIWCPCIVRLPNQLRIVWTQASLVDQIGDQMN
jgi:hypothetical protein